MDWLTIGMLAILAVLIFFMFRNSRKRRQQAEELQTKMVPGAKVMTSFGLFGTVVSVDEVANEANIEISPGVIVTVHRQTLAKVVEATEADPNAPRSVEEAMEIANREQAEREAAEAAAAETEPKYGERTETAKKPRASKKTGE
jgi:preprotein translocase subunit YajC